MIANTLRTLPLIAYCWLFGWLGRDWKFDHWGYMPRYITGVVLVCLTMLWIFKALAQNKP